jgi:hypothetical protein
MYVRILLVLLYGTFIGTAVQPIMWHEILTCDSRHKHILCDMKGYFEVFLKSVLLNPLLLSLLIIIIIKKYITSYYKTYLVRSFYIELGSVTNKSDWFDVILPDEGSRARIRNFVFIKHSPHNVVCTTRCCYSNATRRKQI